MGNGGKGWMRLWGKGQVLDEVMGKGVRVGGQRLEEVLGKGARVGEGCW